MKNVALPVAPHFGPASLDFHSNRPVISLIQLYIVPPRPPPAGIVAPSLAPIWLVPEPSLSMGEEVKGLGVLGVLESGRVMAFV